MDALDQKIIKALSQNADLTNAELAAQIHLSPSSCLRRVKRLKQNGVIQKIVALVDPAHTGRSLKAIVDVTLDRHAGPACDTLLQKIRQEQAVSQAYGVTGDSDMVLILQLQDMQEYQQICDRLFNFDPNVVRFVSRFVMQSYLEPAYLDPACV